MRFPDLYLNWELAGMRENDSIYDVLHDNSIA